MCESRLQEPPRAPLDTNAPSHATIHKQESVEGERWGEGASGNKYMEQERGIAACPC